MRKNIFFVLLLLLLSCKSKKEVIETKTSDTIYQREILKITPKQLNRIVVDDICDSIRPFYYTLKIGKDKTIIKTVDNKLVVENERDSIVERDSELKKTSIKNEKIVEIKEIKNPINLKLLIYSIIATLYILRKPLIKLIKIIK